MMNRYRSGRGRSTGSISVGTPARLATRARAVLATLMLAALAASLIIGLPAINAKNDTHEFIVRRMAIECRTAYDASQSLSLTGGADSYETLARIRSCVYGMEMMNNTAAVLEERALLEESEFSAVYRIVEQYNLALNKGTMTTAAYVTELQNTLGALYDTVLALH